MKKFWMLLLCAVLVLSLCACGGQANTPDPAGTGDATGTTGTDTSTTEDPAAIARSYIDKPLSDLIAVIGEPNSRDYASSCMGDGEDGLLVYDGFVVYTYREGDNETVYDVE